MDLLVTAVQEEQLQRWARAGSATTVEDRQIEPPVNIPHLVTIIGRDEESGGGAGRCVSASCREWSKGYKLVRSDQATRGLFARFDATLE
jgi:hypothetical protein